MRHKRTYFFLIFFIFLIFQGTSALADQFPAVVEAEQRAVLAAERAGILSRLHVDVGGAVKKGDLLGDRITSYNVCYTKLLRGSYIWHNSSLVQNRKLPGSR